MKEWTTLHPNDTWIYDKLIVSTKCGYQCGPAGVRVPEPKEYIIRPCMNLFGMGISARFEFIEDSTDHLCPGDFWCEIFTGEHISIDYQWGKPVLSVVGIRESNNPLWKWSRWERIETAPYEFPHILNELVGEYEWINCEFIGGKLIEVHNRQNPDFRYGNNIAIPVWDDEIADGIFVVDSDYKRKGFYIS